MDSREVLDAEKRTCSGTPTEASQVTELTGPALSYDSDTLTRASTISSGRNSASVVSQRKPTVLDFAEQIRQLEIEGNKLRAANMSSIGQINGLSSETNDFEMPKVQSSSLSNLSTLIDTSADQKYIADLRVQLEKQSKETERLQKQLLGDMSGIYSASTNSHHYTSGHNLSGHNLSGSFSHHNVSNGRGGSFGLPHTHTPEKSAFTTVPSNELHQFFGRRIYDYEPPPHLERSLKESQEQAMDLRKKLQAFTEAAELQRKQFRKTVEDLKSKLHDTILNRDKVLDLRQKESNSQELLINKLQSSLAAFQEKYNLQEEVLASISKKLDSHNQSNSLSEAALLQIRSVLVERESRRGQPYYEADPSSGQSAVMLAHTLQRCLQGLDCEVKIKDCRVLELESEVSEMKMRSSEREKAVATQYQESISQLHMEHKKALADITESASVARQQVTQLQNQIQENEDKSRQKLKDQEMEVQELKDGIDELKADNMKARALWQEKLIEAKHDLVATERLHQALESSLDEVQRELIETTIEKNELLQSESVMRTQVEDLQSLVKRFEGDLKIEQDKVHQQRKREEDLRSEVMTLEMELANKQGDIDRLEKMLELVKQECSATVSDKVSSVENMEKDRYVDQLKYLTTQLSIMTDRCNKATVEQQGTRDEMDSLRSQVGDLTSKLEKARSQMESALGEKHDLTALLGDKHESLDRLHRDKDHHIKVAEQRADEITELRITLDRLKTQLDEKEKILSTFRQQSCSISQLMEVSARASESIREERDKLASALAEKADQMEELKVSHGSCSKKVMVAEERIKDLEDEVLKVSEELVVKNQELELHQQEKETIYRELNESRSEVANLVSAQDVLKKEVARTRALRLKETNKLQSKLKESEQGYKLSQKALRSKDIVDHKAVKFADKIQKEMTVKRSEIDLLSSKLHRLEESLETVAKEKSILEKDKESLKKGLAKSLLHTKELSAELQKSEDRKRELAGQIDRLEEELEQAVLRAKTSSAMVEKFEQEITTLKLKQQLDLKEAERLARIKNGRPLLYTTPRSSSLSTDSSNQHQSNIFSDRKADVEKELSSLTNHERESDAPLTMNCLQKRDTKHRNYSDVGRELKSLVADMKNLVSGEDKYAGDVITLTPRHKQTETGKDALKESSKDLDIFLALQTHERKTMEKDLLFETDQNKSWASNSLSKLGNVSDFSSFKDWRPRSNSLTRQRQLSTCNHDAGVNSSIISKGMHSGSSQKYTRSADKTGALLPNTQELCRRLEEKIDSLTRMGGNLVKENKEMAELINMQGKKLGAVKQIEKNSWEQR